MSELHHEGMRGADPIAPLPICIPDIDVFWFECAVAPPAYDMHKLERYPTSIGNFHLEVKMYEKFLETWFEFLISICLSKSQIKTFPLDLIFVCVKCIEWQLNAENHIRKLHFFVV